MNIGTIYLFLFYMGPRSGELVFNERKRPKELEEISGPTALRRRHPSDDIDDDDGEALDPESHLFTQMLSRITWERGRPKALCYEDILLTVVRNPETGKDIHLMAVRLLHHKGEDRKPKP